jgi:hypothetical protein
MLLFFIQLIFNGGRQRPTLKIQEGSDLPIIRISWQTITAWVRTA